MSRRSLAVLTALVALTISVPGAPAEAKRKQRCPAGQKAVAGHCHAVKHKKKKATRKVKRHRAPAAPVRTPITADLLPGSSVSFTFGDAPRTAPLTGAVSGFIPGGYQLGRDNTITLTRGTINVGAVDLLTDACAGPQPAALDPATTATLDPRRTSRAFIARSGDVIVDVATTLRAALDLRGGDCGAGIVPTGYADTPLSTMLRGRIAMGTGLNALTLDADPVSTTVNGCLAPAAPADPCPVAPATFPTTLTMHVITRVRIG